LGDFILTAKIRIGIDVGGTFTKSVAIDDDTYEIVGKVTQLTTHNAAEGVAKGVVEVFQKTLSDFKISPDDVVFIAHSTTQATNALLEGDVVPVGIIGMGRGLDGLRARGEIAVKDIELAPGRMISVHSTFIDTSNINEEKIKEAIRDLCERGAKVLVASETYSVDDPRNELLVMSLANQMGILATGGHEITKLYGLKVRTRTAAINASILPKMMETAQMTEQSIRKVGTKANLMIMRGDGGVMDVEAMRKRPILSMLSGPSASVAGALMYLRISDGIFFEVGGTSTNVGVIQFGRPAIKYAEVGGHKTYVSSLDVRTIGIAGGSMPRISGNQIVDVGPRSAHIAGLPYSSFFEGEIQGSEVVLFQPKPGDPNDYACIRTADGRNVAITNTCAANALGITKEGDYSYGNQEAAKKAVGALARKLGMTTEETARRILEISSAKVIHVINRLIEDYKLERTQVVLIGGGGGAAALIPFTAKVTGLSYEISKNAEVISSIGVALAMVRDVVERTVPNPTSEDLFNIRKEVEQAAIKAGAAPETIEIFVEIDARTQRLRAIALGSTELRTKQLKTELPVEERKRIAAKSMGLGSDGEMRVVGTTDAMEVFEAEVKRKGFLGISSTKKLARVVDRNGVIRLNAMNATIIQSSVGETVDLLKKYLDKLATMTDGGLMIPSPFILYGARILDYSGLMDAKQILPLAEADLRGVDPKTPAVLIFNPKAF
jgi:N-methylhydantoinase A/oxoprolinase/acetone carboxylase beta subunit